MKINILFYLIGFLIKFSSCNFDNSTLSKCCPINYELSFQNSSSTSSCVPFSGSGSFLTTIYDSDNLMTANLPECSKFEILDLNYAVSQEQEVSYFCIDKSYETGNLIGIRCLEEQQEKMLSDKIQPPPAVNSIRKCCPLNRAYDNQKQFCWNEQFEDNERNHRDLLKLTVKNFPKKNFFINLQFGFPECKSNEVLTDITVPYKNITILENNSAVLYTSKFDGGGGTGGKILLNSEDFCTDVVDNIFEEIVVRFCVDYQVACKRGGNDLSNNVCIRKCCPNGQMYNGSRICSETKEPLSISFYKIAPNGRDAIVVPGLNPSYLNGSVCKGAKYFLKPDIDPNDKYYFTTEGHVYVPSTKGIHDTAQYCVENVLREDLAMNGTYVFICFPDQEEDVGFLKLRTVKQTATLIGSILSSIFLLLTFLVYACLPSLQNLHGKTVMCHVSTLLVGYIVLTVMRLDDLFQYTAICISLGYTMLFAFLSAFCWMNVICYDIWSTFGTVRSAFVKKSGITRRFILYRLYGWGLPALWTGITILCQFGSFLDDKSILKPDIHKTSCWFDDYGFSRLIFFIVPVSIIIICNTVLFVMTVRYCSKIRSELNSIQSNDYAKNKLVSDTRKLVMNTKLFVAMGINWALEMISLVVRPENRQFFFFSDLINSLGGILIFLIFIVKKKTLNDLRNRFTNNNNNSSTKQSSNTFRSTISTSASSATRNSITNNNDSILHKI